MPNQLQGHDFTLLPGQVAPFGANISADGCNFSIYCPDAKDVYLCLFDEADIEIAQIKLKQRVQSKWFGFVKGVSEGQKYAYRVNSKDHRKVNTEMDVGRLLIDPYAKQLSHALVWDRDAYVGKTSPVIGQAVKDNQAFIPKSIVTASVPCDRLKHSSNSLSTNGEQPDRIIYEAHVKGLTQNHPDVPAEQRGKYLGACHPSVLAHLKSLGVTCIQFLPVFAFMPEPYISEKGLTNYWGYNPINFFSPEPRYAVKDALAECKHMVSEYQKAGFEVILDVVFNHTAESGEPGSILSFKGLCHRHAYLQIVNDELNTPTYINYSGCGNTVNTADTYMMTLIIDSLRYWVSEIGIDGFRFDLAASLGREPIDFHADATIFKILRQDPVLKNAIMIAEPWDIGPGGYQLGQFPDYWLEVNDKYRDTVRGFWRSDTGLKADFATRFMGSRDVFPKGMRPMLTSVNNITYHDGFTLHDLVSYSKKHNKANLEDNHDGHNHNLSDNYGVEGETSDLDILELREQQKRNLFATLILSQGTPHILGGDELSRSQLGNNNAYCQDNELNWLNWELDERQKSFLAFTKYVIQLRKENPLLSHMMFEDDQFDSQVNIDTADWYRVDGSFKRDQDWTNQDHHCFALHIIGATKASPGQQVRKAQEWLYVVNSSKKSVEFNLPLLLKNQDWKCVLNTAISDIADYESQSMSPLFTMEARSFCLFKHRD
ncbi:glycogen debranching protein GlgX [Glaciecola sp. MF2-115]|uniref:glycogen debranching protein GlgX n=1 Tax=Glaciecola sp. MF2-115 TaxID=3384827 RepID=UPI0039A1FBAD